MHIFHNRIFRKISTAIITVCFLFTPYSQVCIAGTAPNDTDTQEQPKKGKIIADLVMLNGNIHTMDTELNTAQAIAVKKGKIIFIGDNDNAEKYINKKTEVIDLKGSLVLPSFIDSHAHASAATGQLFNVSLLQMNSLEKYIAAVKEYLSANPEITVIQGGGWSNTVFSPTGPTKESLDAVSADIPIAISSEDYHSLWVNSKALEMAKITKDTPDPDNGRIERNEAGEPSGTLRESAMDLVTDILPDYSVEEYEQGILAYQDLALSVGTTGAWDPMPTENAIKAYQNLARNGLLKLYIRSGYRLDPEDKISTISKLNKKRKNASVGDIFKINSIKIFTDGVIEGTTAYLNEPYEEAAGTAAGYRGTPIWQPDELNKAVAAANKAGFSVHIHAIGDAACTESLDAFAYSSQKNKNKDNRNAITHLQLVDPADYSRFDTNNVIAVPDPYWAMKDDYYYNLQLPYLGKERADAEYPVKSFFDNNTVVASGSDFPVTYPPDPLVAIEVGVSRTITDAYLEYLGGDLKFTEPLWAEQACTLDQMLTSFTRNGAYANFMENLTGDLSVGKSADMVILDNNLYNIPVNEISKSKVTKTYFAGELVYGNQ